MVKWQKLLCPFNANLLHLIRSTQLKHELQNILSGKSSVSHGAIIQAIASYLDDGAQAGPRVEDAKQIKEQETAKLITFIASNHLWLNDIDFSKYISEGAEQRVYLKDAEYVLKLNDSIYYSSWRNYLINLLFHNFFFPDTAYKLLGFTMEGNQLFAVVQQPYVLSTELTNLENVKSFLAANGFLNTRKNDYFNAEAGIILEDLHDENVLTNHGILYFIDTVFYPTPSFWLQS